MEHSKKRLQKLAGILNENFLVMGNGLMTTPSLGMSSDVPAYTSQRYGEPDIEIGHEDDELGMLKSDVGTMCDDLKDLYDILCDLHDHGKEIDFPHWWQGKIILAKDYIAKATDYLKQEVEY